MQSRFGVSLAEGYGLTEASPVVTTATGLEHRSGSIGAPRARGRGPPGRRRRRRRARRRRRRDLGARARTSSRATGTTPRRPATALTDDGWLRTGDIAVVDDDGFLYLVDRAKDLIIVSGFNVYPAEVEEVLIEHPAIERCAVVGVPHPHSGEAVKAYVVVAAGHSIEEDEVIDLGLGPARPLQVPREGDVRRRPARRAWPARSCGARCADAAAPAGVALDRTGGELGRAVVLSDGRSPRRRVREQEADEHDGDAAGQRRRRTPVSSSPRPSKGALPLMSSVPDGDEHVGHGHGGSADRGAATQPRPRSTAPRR